MKNPFKKKYHYACLVEFDEDHKPCFAGASCSWIDTIVIESYFYKLSLRKAFKLMEDKYPEYKGFIQF